MKIQNSNKENIIQPKNENIQNCKNENFDDFIGQEYIKNVLRSGIISSLKRNDTLGHILFSGDSGFGKTTLSKIIAGNLNKKIKIITAYAMEKQSDMISVLNQLEDGDILFIDEIHRLKPKIEEILYIAMEDFRVDIILEDETTSIPINKFTLIGATNKLECLSDAFKNRFIYKFHLKPYTHEETKKILNKYLKEFNINCKQNIIQKLSKKTLPVPREIKNLAIRIRDFLIANGFYDKNLYIKEDLYFKIIENLKLGEYGLSDLQKTYLEILEKKEILGLETISSMLNISKKVIEKDIEPLLINVGIIEKTKKGRKLIKKIEK